jgi:hypothetical protein
LQEPRHSPSQEQLADSNAAHPTGDNQLLSVANTRRPALVALTMKWRILPLCKLIKTRRAPSSRPPRRPDGWISSFPSDAALRACRKSPGRAVSNSRHLPRRTLVADFPILEAAAIRDVAHAPMRRPSGA